MGFKVVCLGLGFALTLSACQAPSSDSTFIRPLPELSSDMKATQGSSPLGQAFADSAFKRWAQSGFNRTRELDRYANYLERSTGTIPPLNQLTLSARSYAKCGRDAYMLAPSNLWPQMVPTLNLYKLLLAQGVLPASSEIVSVYRDPALNRCAGGVGGSKHMDNNALDIELNQDGYEHALTMNKLCEFWKSNGARYGFGLGIYRGGSIHIDTSGYRHWGSNYSSSTSTC